METLFLARICVLLDVFLVDDEPGRKFLRNMSIASHFPPRWLPLLEEMVPIELALSIYNDLQRTPKTGVDTC